MPEEQSIATVVLSQWGASVKPITESDKEESDLFVEIQGLRLLVEEKAKFEDDSAVSERNSALDRGGLHSNTEALRKDNRISGIVSKAVKQLSSTAEDVPHDLRLIWFTAMGSNAFAKFEQFIGTLYGTKKVFELNGPVMRSCYFFRNGDFFRHPSIDGAVAAHLEADGKTLRMKLCLNPYSGGWMTLRDSPLARHFPTGIIDPRAEEALGEAYFADTDIDRRDEEAVLDFVSRKYKLKMAQAMDLGHTAIRIRVPPAPEE